VTSWSGSEKVASIGLGARHLEQALRIEFRLVAELRALKDHGERVGQGKRAAPVTSEDVMTRPHAEPAMVPPSAVGIVLQ
jgi:hypothetical protein